MAKRAASSESPLNLSQSPDGSDPDEDLIQFVGPMTVQDVGNAFLANRTLNGFPNTIIITLAIGGIDFIWQNLTQQELGMPFVDFVNMRVINSASASRLRRIRQLLLDDRGRICFSQMMAKEVVIKTMIASTPWTGQKVSIYPIHIDRAQEEYSRLFAHISTSIN